jgi:TPR repeat protein
LQDGDGVPTNKADAAHYFKLAVDQGHAEAQLKYELCLQDGDRVDGDEAERDEAEAARYLEQAADQGVFRRVTSLLALFMKWSYSKARLIFGFLAAVLPQ